MFKIGMFCGQGDDFGENETPVLPSTDVTGCNIGCLIMKWLKNDLEYRYPASGQKVPSLNMLFLVDC